ncbi:hypothetical protein T07_8069 [Trichinella nelsoni]|uniref:Uncharacterized protein n=1 Tax=Trichinella nelsoni TaxID=6336 RepID=A0A0V0RBR6_9BILA|nr:hypothetical protein T07_8069 [Trichinella nelsoni]
MVVEKRLCFACLQCGWPGNGQQLRSEMCGGRMQSCSPRALTLRHEEGIVRIVAGGLHSLRHGVTMFLHSEGPSGNSAAYRPV